MREKQWQRARARFEGRVHIVYSHALLFSFTPPSSSSACILVRFSMARTKDTAPIQQRQQSRGAPARSRVSSSSSSESDDDRPRPRAPFIRRIPAASTASKNSASHKTQPTQPPPRGGVSKPRQQLHLAAIVAQRARSSVPSPREEQRLKPSGSRKGHARAAVLSSSSSGSTSSSAAPSPPRGRSKASAAQSSGASAAHSTSALSSYSRMPDEDLVKFFAAVDDALASSVGRLRGSDKLRVSCGSSVAWRSVCHIAQ